MKIHPIETPYGDNETFYTELPEELPVQKTVECPETGKDIELEYLDSDEDNVAFEVLIEKAEDEEEDQDDDSSDDKITPPEEIFGDQ